MLAGATLPKSDPLAIGEASDVTGDRARLLPKGGVMATVTLNWDHVEFDADAVSGWVSFKRAADIVNHPNLLSSRAVYVIRIMRPYSFD